MDNGNNKVKNFPLHFLATFISILATPFVIYYLIIMAKQIDFSLEKIKYAFWGLVLSLVILSFSSFLQWVYIFFHELSHAISAIIFKGQIIDFKVRRDAGHIKSDKENIFIRLAPYIFPLACYLILLVHYLVLIYTRYFTGEIKDFYLGYFLITFFYTVVTFYNIKLILKETSDIDRDKLLLSFSMILNFYSFFSVLLFYLLFNGKNLVERYFLL